MEFRGVFLLAVIGAVICCVQGYPNPRDSTVVKIHDVSRVDGGSIAAVPKDKITLPDDIPTEKMELPKETIPLAEKNSIIAPKYVSCQSENATQEKVCQDHCSPKGYKYGLCVGHKCQCV